MRDISVYDAAYMLFVNPTAAYYAVVAAVIIAPLYVFVLESILVAVIAKLSEWNVCGRIRAQARGMVSGRQRRGSGSGRRRETKGPWINWAALSACVACPWNKASPASVAHADERQGPQATTSPGRPSAGSRRSSAVRESGLYSTPNSAITTPPRGSRGGSALAFPPAQDPFIDDQAAFDDEADAEEEEEADFVEPSSPSTRVESDIAIYGQPLKLSDPVPPFTAKGANWKAQKASSVAAHRAFVSTGNAQVDAAMLSGEVYYQPASRVLTIEANIRRMFMRHQRNRLYRDSNITTQSLNDLFRRPAFQQWYDERREDLLEEVQVRRNGLRLRSWSTFVTLMLGLCALPAFSFSSKTWANLPFFLTKSGGGFMRLPGDAPVSQATFVQLLAARADYIQGSRGIPTAVTSCRVVAEYVPASITRGVFQLINHIEVIAMLAAACALVTSTFMPRGRKTTAVVATWALGILMLECTMADSNVAVRMGMGVGVVFGVVAVSIAKAFQ